jgi:predicted Zn finger-like uncharacterized protein
MYITCENCNTVFIVTYEQIGEAGRKVKCSKCTNIWHQKPLSKKHIIPVQISTKTSDFKPPAYNAHLPVPIVYTPRTHNSFTFLLITMIILLTYLLFETTI